MTSGSDMSRSPDSLLSTRTRPDSVRSEPAASSPLGAGRVCQGSPGTPRGGAAPERSDTGRPLQRRVAARMPDRGASDASARDGERNTSRTMSEFATFQSLRGSRKPVPVWPPQTHCHSHDPRTTVEVSELAKRDADVKDRLALNGFAKAMLASWDKHAKSGGRGGDNASFLLTLGELAHRFDTSSGRELSKLHVKLFVEETLSLCSGKLVKMQASGRDDAGRDHVRVLTRGVLRELCHRFGETIGQHAELRAIFQRNPGAAAGFDVEHAIETVLGTYDRATGGAAHPPSEERSAQNRALIREASAALQISAPSTPVVLLGENGRLVDAHHHSSFTYHAGEEESTHLESAAELFKRLNVGRIFLMPIPHHLIVEGGLELSQPQKTRMYYTDGPGEVTAVFHRRDRVMLDHFNALDESQQKLVHPCPTGFRMTNDNETIEDNRRYARQFAENFVTAALEAGEERRILVTFGEITANKPAVPQHDMLARNYRPPELEPERRESTPRPSLRATLSDESSGLERAFRLVPLDEREAGPSGRLAGGTEAGPIGRSRRFEGVVSQVPSPLERELPRDDKENVVDGVHRIIVAMLQGSRAGADAAVSKHFEGRLEDATELRVQHRVCLHADAVPRSSEREVDLRDIDAYVRRIDESLTSAYGPASEANRHQFVLQPAHFFGVSVENFAQLERTPVVHKMIESFRQDLSTLRVEADLSWFTATARHVSQGMSTFLNTSGNAGVRDIARLLEHADTIQHEGFGHLNRARKEQAVHAEDVGGNVESTVAGALASAAQQKLIRVYHGIVGEIYHSVASNPKLALRLNQDIKEGVTTDPNADGRDHAKPGNFIGLLYHLHVVERTGCQGRTPFVNGSDTLGTLSKFDGDLVAQVDANQYQTTVALLAGMIAALKSTGVQEDADDAAVYQQVFDDIHYGDSLSRSFFEATGYKQVSTVGLEDTIREQRTDPHIRRRGERASWQGRQALPLKSVDMAALGVTETALERRALRLRRTEASGSGETSVAADPPLGAAVAVIEAMNERWSGVASSEAGPVRDGPVAAAREDSGDLFRRGEDSKVTVVRL